MLLSLVKKSTKTTAIILCIKREHIYCFPILLHRVEKLPEHIFLLRLLVQVETAPKIN